MRKSAHPADACPRENEFWFVRLMLWRPVALVYGVLIENLATLRTGGTSMPRARCSYDDVLVPMLALAAVARAPLGMLSVLCFGLSFARSHVVGPGPQDWLDVTGLTLAWTAALGVATSVGRMAVERILRRRVEFLMRTRLAEPRNGDIVWQLIIGAAAAWWWHLQ